MAGSDESIFEGVGLLDGLNRGLQRVLHRVQVLRIRQVVVRQRLFLLIVLEVERALCHVLLVTVLASVRHRPLPISRCIIIVVEEYTLVCLIIVVQLMLLLGSKISL